MKRIVSLLLVLCLALCLSVGAMAKTSSEPIEAPAGDFAVFTVSAAGRTAGFTWDEISGRGDFKSVTGVYPAKVDGEQTTQEWTGIPLSVLLDAAIEELGFGFADDCLICAEAADGFVSVFSVLDARDGENAYIVAPDPVKNFDGETQYPDSYVRILRAAETSNNANIRCVTGITIKGADGSDLMAISGPEVPEEPAEASFDDVAEGDWFYDAVSYAVEKGMMNGVGEGKFDPNGTTNRAMLVTILYRIEGSPEVDASVSPFFDVPPDAEGFTPQWYTNAVIWAAENGIVEGYVEGPHKIFNPNGSITREQFAAILYRCEQMKGGGFTGLWYFPLDFEDAADVSDWADEAMHWCVMNGVITGKTETTLVPGGSASRAEAATMLMRYCELNAEY